MEKKEAKLTMGLLAALAMSPAVSTANDSSVQQDTTQIIKDGVSITVKNEALQAALMISIGQAAILSDEAYAEGVKVLEQIEELRKQSVDKPVELKAGDKLSKQMIEQLLESNKADFNPSAAKAAVIFQKMY